MSLLARILNWLRRFDDSQQLLERLHILRREIMGEDDPSTVWARNQMAGAACCKEQMRLEEAWRIIPFISHPDIESVTWLCDATQTDDPTRRLAPAEATTPGHDLDTSILMNDARERRRSFYLVFTLVWCLLAHTLCGRIWGLPTMDTFHFLHVRIRDPN